MWVSLRGLDFAVEQIKIAMIFVAFFPPFIKM